MTPVRMVSAKIGAAALTLTLVLAACGTDEITLCPIDEPITVRGDATAWPEPILAVCIHDRCSEPAPDNRVHTVQYQDTMPNRLNLSVVDAAGDRVTLGEGRSDDCSMVGNVTTITLIGHERGFRFVSD